MEKQQKTEFTCPYCDIDVGSTSKLLIHQDTPIDLGLPKGLIYLNPRFDFYGIITDAGAAESGLNKPIEYIHTRNHFVVKYHLQDEMFSELPVVRNSKDLETRLNNEQIRLLSLEEFIEFEKKYNELIKKPDQIPEKVYQLLQEIPKLKSICEEGILID